MARVGSSGLKVWKRPVARSLVTYSRGNPSLGCGVSSLAEVSKTCECDKDNVSEVSVWEWERASYYVKFARSVVSLTKGSAKMTLQMLL